jgi:hypothetical protein
VAAVVALVLAAAACRDGGDPSTVESPRGSTSPQPVSTATAPGPVVQIRFANGTLTTSHRELQVGTGTQVTLAVATDRADELVVSGMDVRAQLTPGPARNVVFVPGRVGTYQVVLIRSGRQVMTLRVTG